VEGKKKPIRIQAENVPKYLGPAKYYSEVSDRIQEPGVTTGLAWTPNGGAILFVEATRVPGKGGLQLTGSLGDVMKESAQAAFTVVRSNADSLKLKDDLFETSDIHIHVPAGATPKDGPSAGIAMATTLASLLTGRRVRNDTAMTGEITLRGKVLPVGGIKEKVIAAERAGIRQVVLPERNRKDLADVPARVKKKMKFKFVDNIRDVFLYTLLRPGNNTDHS